MWPEIQQGDAQMHICQSAHLLGHPEKTRRQANFPFYVILRSYSAVHILHPILNVHDVSNTNITE